LLLEQAFLPKEQASEIREKGVAAFKEHVSSLPEVLRELAVVMYTGSKAALFQWASPVGI
jgi:hypothetical protein